MRTSSVSASLTLFRDPDARKDELIETLDAYLKANGSRLSHNETFQPYFDTRRTPFKPRPGSATEGANSDDPEVKSVVKARGRRTTKVKQEDEYAPAAQARLRTTERWLTTACSDVGPILPSSAQRIYDRASAVLTRTPAISASRRRRSDVLPASPADITEDVEILSQNFTASVNDLWAVSGIAEFIDEIRDLCSSVHAVQATFLIFEASCLQKSILPPKHIGDIPSLHAFGITTPAIPLKVLDIFSMFTGAFVNSALLWLATSAVLPAIVGYFYNLSIRDTKRHGTRVTTFRHAVDPLTFNVAKALLTYLVYAQGYTFGLFDEVVAARVENAMFHGHQSMMVGSFVGMLVSLYDAAQRK